MQLGEPGGPRAQAGAPGSDAGTCERRRASRTECAPDGCELGAACPNQRLRRREWQPVVRQGERLLATAAVPQGALLLEACGELFAGSLQFARALLDACVPWPPELCFLSLGGESSLALDVSRAGSLARCVAQSAEPNCELQVWLVDGLPRVGVFAARHISAGSALSADYSLAAVGQGGSDIPLWWCARLRRAPRAARPPPPLLGGRLARAPRSPTRLPTLWTRARLPARPPTLIPGAAPPAAAPEGAQPAAAARAHAAPPAPQAAAAGSAQPGAHALAGEAPGPAAQQGRPAAPPPAAEGARVRSGRARERVLVVGGERRSCKRLQEWSRGEEGVLVAMTLLSKASVDPLTAWSSRKKHKAGGSAKRSGASHA